jgi:chloramphenicol 3-O phosphotransferase
MSANYIICNLPSVCDSDALSLLAVYIMVFLKKEDLMTKMANIIFLNGVGSVGKTSIVKALQAALGDAYLHVGVDQFIDMLPPQYIGDPQGLMFETAEIDGKPVVTIKSGEVFQRLMQGMRHAMQALALQGNNLIIDEVLIGDEWEQYIELLAGFRLHFVGLYAPLATLEVRERQREDRLIGLARGQYHVVHEGKRYDLEIDTTKMLPAECAKLIIRHFQLQ